MEQHIVSLNKGIHRTPSTGESGELSECVGLVVRDGELRNAPVLSNIEEAVTLGEGEILLYMHKVDSAGETKKNYVIKNDTGVGIKGESENLFAFTSGENVIETKSLGNILIVNTSVKMRMYMWESNGYKDYTINEIKPLNVRFALRGEFERMAGSGVDIVKKDKIITEDDNIIKSVWSYEKTHDDTTYYTPQYYLKHITFSEDTKLEGGKSYIIAFVDSNGDSVYVRKPAENAVNVDIIGVNVMGVGNGLTGLFSTEEIGENGNYVRPVQLVAFSGQQTTQIAFTVKEGLTIYRIAISVYSKEPFRMDIYEKVSDGGSTTYKVDTSNIDNINAVLGTANKFINNKVTEKNKFIFPFFVRAAIKLVDGTYIKPSCPTLMIPSNGVEPKISINTNDLQTSSTYGTTKCATMASAVTCDLYYKILDNDTLAELQSMSAIVDSLVVAVSEPIRRYKASPTVEESKEAMDIKQYEECAGYYTLGTVPNSDSCRQSRQNAEEARYHTRYSSDEISLPENKNISDELEKIGAFYIVKRIPIGELSASDSYEMVSMDEGTLTNLVTRQRMLDNTTSLQSITAKTIFTYNNRLALANYKQVPFEGYPLSLMCGVDDEKGSHYNMQAYTRITLNISGRIVRTNIQKSNINLYGSILWFYYPNSKAVSAELFIHSEPKYAEFGNTETYVKLTMDLKEHPLLKGAYAFNSFKSLMLSEKYERISKDEWNDIKNDNSDSDVIVFENGIMQSMVNNPFEFDDALTSTVGRGEIKALSTTTKALSEGQFGSFPLIAFGEEGIWAISVSGEGKFQGVQPISRDCILDGVQPLQIDDAVVFPTSGGLNVLSGSSVADISDNFEGMNEDVTIAKGIMTTFDSIIKNEANGFNVSLEDAEMAWDSDNKLIHVWTSDAHYVCDLKTKEWTKSSEGKPDRIIHGYPHTTLQFGTELKEYKRTNDSTTKRKGFLMTREMAFGAPMSMKVVDQLKMYTKLQSADSSIMVAAFVSNDRMTWHRLKSLKTSSWKWYKFAIYTDMTDVESVCGIVLTAEERRTGRLR